MDSLREPLPSLPDDAEALRALVLAALAERDAMASERDAAASERDALLAQTDRLRHLLLKLTRMHFGARSERLPEEQLQLGLAALEQAIAKEDAQAEKQDGELRRDHVQPLGGVLPDHCHRRPAARARGVLGHQRHLNPRQMCRQRTAAGPPLGNILPPQFGILLLGLAILFGNRLLKCCQTQLQLFLRQTSRSLL